jgi:hypothetical protein
MAEDNAYGFDAETVDRIIDAVKFTESCPSNVTNPQPRRAGGRVSVQNRQMVRVSSTTAVTSGAVTYFPGFITLLDAGTGTKTDGFGIGILGPNDETLSLKYYDARCVGTADDGTVLFLATGSISDDDDCGCGMCKLPKTLAPTTNCDIYRPYSAGSPTTTGVQCQLTPCLSGQSFGGSPPTPAYYTHVMDLDTTTDIRDGCSRQTNQPQQQFGMGDKVQIPSGTAGTSGSTYAVTWVEWVNRGVGDDTEFKRVYLSRDVPIWGGVGSP